MAYAPIDPIPTGLRTMPQPDFDEAMAGYMTQLPISVTQMNSLGTYVDAQAAIVAAAAVDAAANAAAAIAAGGATVWVSGATYTAGNVRYSPIDFKSYRRKTNGAGTTDPSADQTNWVLISSGTIPYLKVSDRKASTQNGGGSVGGDITQTRTLNTVETNTITGASLASNTVTLPAGTYRFRARAPVYSAAASTQSKLFLYNSSDATYAGIGSNTQCLVDSVVDSWVSGQLTIAATKNFTLRHYTSTTAGGTGLGYPVSISGQLEVYAELEIWKVA